MLRWLSFAAQPLTLGELQEARLIDSSGDGNIAWDDPGSIEDIVEILGDLVHVHMPFEAGTKHGQRVGSLERDWFAYQSYHNYVRQHSKNVGVRIVSQYDLQDEDQEMYNGWLEQEGKSFARVRLAHFSVKEYLTSAHVPQDMSHDLPLEEHLAHRTMGEDCLTYLRRFSERCPDGWSSLEKLNFPLLNYAVNNWPTHVDKHDGDALHHEVMLLQNDKSRSDWLRAKYGIYNSVPDALYCASDLGHRACVEVLLESGQSVDAVGGWKLSETPLQIASEKGHLEVVKVLIGAGADVNRTSTRNHPILTTALCEAAGKGHEEIVAVLLAAGANVQAVIQTECQGFGTAALHAASAHGHASVVRQLIDAGADVRAADYMSSVELTAVAPALHIAAAIGHVATVCTLIDAGADVNASGRLINDPSALSSSTLDDTEAHTTALLAATSNGHTEVVKMLVDAGADLRIGGFVKYLARMFETTSIQDLYSFVATALHAAAAIGHDEIVSILLEAGADANAIGHISAEEVFTPLCAASEAGCLGVVIMLLEAGAEILELPPGYRHPLVAAAGNGHVEVVVALLEAGAEANARSDTVSALGIAAAQGHVHVVETLVRAGAYTDYDDYHGHTAIMIASAEGYVGVVLVLLDEAAGQPNALPGFEQAIDLAAKEGHTVIEQMLLDQLMMSQLQ